MTKTRLAHPVRGTGRWRRPARWPRDTTIVRTGGDVPNWQLDKEFAKDVFTFVRIQYSSGYGGRGTADAGTDGATTVAAEAAGRRTTPTAT